MTTNQKAGAGGAACLCVLFCGPFLVRPAFAAEDAPAWLKEAAAVAPTQYGPKVSSVVLFNEEQNSVSPTGRITTTTRTAVRILSRQGGDIDFMEEYDTGGRVRDFRAWMISPSGKIKKYGKDEILDIACTPNDVYNECREKMVSGKRDAEAGAIFGYEATVERQPFSQQLMFHFQDASPVRLARFTVTVPPGWEIKASAFNGAPEPTQPAGAYTWQMENLAPIEPEPRSPGFGNIVPWVGVNLLGPDKHSVLSWNEAAKLMAEVNQGQEEPDAALTAKAKSLTEGAATELDKIRAIGHFAQQVNYVSIQINLSRGGGIRPHPAALVFQKLYGDCKDKANLMRAMLKAVGITAYPVAIYSGDRTRVSGDWPSLGAFNHAISAIRVGPETKASAVLDDPKLGRLLFFDPTDPYVPAGYLPDHEQASLALVGAPEPGGGLVRVPSSPADASTRYRQVEAILKPDGSISGSFSDKRTGESFAEAIGTYRGSSKEDYSKMIERWIARGIPGAATTGIEATETGGEFIVKGQFAASRFARIPQARMMIFKAALLPHGDSSRLTEKTRKYPVVLDTDALSETVHIVLPDGFHIDELPDPVHLESQFGNCDAKWSGGLASLTFTRRIEVKAQIVPANQYGEVRKFLDVAYGSPELPIVLVR